MPEAGRGGNRVGQSYERARSVERMKGRHEEVKTAGRAKPGTLIAIPFFTLTF